MEFASRDIISSLPSAVISHILSFLPTKTAASTSVLARQWRYLFTSVTNLEFDDSVYLHSEAGSDNEFECSSSFIEFVNKVLIMQGERIINRFSLHCGYTDPVLVTKWICNVLERGVSDLVLEVSEYPLPSKILVSKTLVNLKLGPADNLSFIIEGKDVFLPKLKSLYIDSVSFEEDGRGLAKLLSGCPVLEELALVNIWWENWKFYSVSITTLKKLIICCGEIEESTKKVSFDTPNLLYLEYTDLIANKYPKVNFGSLVEAHIGLQLSEDQSYDANLSEEEGYFSEESDEQKQIGNATDVFKEISTVKILYLSAKAIEVLTFCCEQIPVFNNLIQLTIENNSEIVWDSLPSLLEKCPNVETLVLKRLVHKYNKKCGNICCCRRPKNPSYLSSSPVKVLKIFLFDDNDEEERPEIRQLKYFVEKMPRLEQLIVYYNTSYDPSVLELSKKLQKITKTASPKCKIQVISDNLSLTCTVPAFWTTKWSGLPPEEEYRYVESPPPRPLELKDFMQMDEYGDWF